MRYALLAYAEPGAWDDLSDEERAAWAADDAAFAAELEEGGRAVAGYGLDDAMTATTVRVSGGEATLGDGPAVDAGEVLDRVLVIEAADLDEALAIARRCPAARIGPLEVRPLVPGA